MPVQTPGGGKLEGSQQRKSYSFARHLILANPDNPRNMSSPETLDNIAKLKRGIKARGYDRDAPMLGWLIEHTWRSEKTNTQPFIDQFEGYRFLLYNGHCRLAAIDELTEEGAQFAELPCERIKEGLKEPERLAISLRYAGADVSPLDAAEQIIALQGWLWDNQRICDYTGRDVAWLERCLALRGAPAPIRAAVEGEKISPTLADQVLKKEADPVATMAAAARVASARGSEKVRPRDVAAVSKPRQAALAAPRLSPEQKAIGRVLTIWDGWRRRRDHCSEDFIIAVEALRDLLPHDAEAA